MKKRLGFVSNSSSSSFIINLSDITVEQFDKLLIIASAPIGEYGDSWDITEDNGAVHGFTIMDNGQDQGMMLELQKLGIDMTKIVWDNDEG